jgi:hypothetical protein
MRPDLELLQPLVMFSARVRNRRSSSQQALAHAVPSDHPATTSVGQ